MFSILISLAAANPCDATVCPVAEEISAALELQQEQMELQLASGEYRETLGSSRALADAARAAEAQGVEEGTRDVLHASWAAWDIANDASKAESLLDQGSFEEAKEAAHQSAERVRGSNLSETTKATLLQRLGSLWTRANQSDSLDLQRQEMEQQLSDKDYKSVLESSRALADSAQAAHSAGAISEERASSLRKSAWAAWNAADAALKEGATSKTRSGAMNTPLVNQNLSGSYPGGYCAIAALRMVLQYEGLNDPGADTVALHGSSPYIPGLGSDPTRLARRARELGLDDASFTNTGRLSDVTAMLDAGKPVMVGGEGTVRGTLESGQGYTKTYFSSGHWMTAVGYESDAAGNVTRVILNDPNTGQRLITTKDQFLSFFAPDGNIWMVRY